MRRKMFNSNLHFTLAPLAFCLVAVACGNGNKDDTGGKLDPASEGLTFTDDNNYSYTGTIEIDAVEVQANADNTIDWCALSEDLRGRPVPDASGVDQVLLVSFQLTQAEVLEKVAKNTLLQADSDLQYTLPEPGRCSGKMSDFAILGNYFDPTSTEAGLSPSDSITWLTSVTNLPQGRIDILMSSFVVPVAGGNGNTVDITNTSTRIDYQANLTSNTPLSAKVGEKGTFDWSNATVDVNGNELDPIRADQLLIGHIPVDTIEEAQAQFLQLDMAADQLYYLDVYDEVAASLADAKTLDGKSFDGFTADGVWLVGIECTSCMSPAPLLLATVEVTE